MTKDQEMELLQLYRDADITGKAFILDMLLCFVHCGDEFIQEIQAAQEDKATIKAVVDKWVSTVKNAGEQSPATIKEELT